LTCTLVDIPAPGPSSDSMLDASHDIYSFFEEDFPDNRWFKAF
jgi:hypothetical protein